jgi:Tfp pilus assembly protein PilP
MKTFAIIVIHLIFMTQAAAQHLRDPFMPDIRSDSTIKVMRNPLGKYSLAQLVLVGIICIQNEKWAILQTPKGYFHAKIGDKIGNQNAKITEIGSKKIVLRSTTAEQHSLPSITELKLKGASYDIET